MSKNPLQNLLAIAQAIEAKGKPGTVRPAAAPAWTIEPKPPVALADMIAKPLAGAPTLDQDKLTLALTRERDAALADLARMRADRDALLADKAALVRELAEARNDRKAEARTIVATDASAWHFITPQGEGTGDRIKAVGGRWMFHKRDVRDQYRAAGYWIVPHSDAARELLRDLLDNLARNIVVKAL